MKFRMSREGIDSASQGIKGIFSTLAQVPLLREQAQMDSALRTAQTYGYTQAGRLNEAKAGQEQFTLDNRKGADAEIAANPDMPVEQRLALWAFKNAGPGHVKDFAGGAGEFQTQGFRQKAADNVGDLDTMNRYNTLAKPGETYLPFDAVGNTGRAVNKATGLGKIVEQALATNYDNKVSSETAENTAQASAANALASRRNAGGTGGLTAAQLRENVMVDEARALLESLSDADYQAVMSGNESMMTAEQKLIYRAIQKANKPKYGETNVPAIAPQPAPPVQEEPGIMQRIANWLTEPDARPAEKQPVKSAAAPTASNTMSALPAQSQQAADAIKAAYRAGKITREEAKRQLQAIGFD